MTLVSPAGAVTEDGLGWLKDARVFFVLPPHTEKNVPDCLQVPVHHRPPGSIRGHPGVVGQEMAGCLGWEGRGSRGWLPRQLQGLGGGRGKELWWGAEVGVGLRAQQATQ